MDITQEEQGRMDRIVGETVRAYAKTRRKLAALEMKFHDLAKDLKMTAEALLHPDESIVCPLPDTLPSFSELSISLKEYDEALSDLARYANALSAFGVDVELHSPREISTFDELKDSLRK